jgi:hypothetical protein
VIVKAQTLDRQMPCLKGGAKTGKCLSQPRLPVLPVSRAHYPQLASKAALLVMSTSRGETIAKGEDKMPHPKREARTAKRLSQPRLPVLPVSRARRPQLASKAALLVMSTSRGETIVKGRALEDKMPRPKREARTAKRLSLPRLPVLPVSRARRLPVPISRALFAT